MDSTTTEPVSTCNELLPMRARKERSGTGFAWHSDQGGMHLQLMSGIEPARCADQVFVDSYMPPQPEPKESYRNRTGPSKLLDVSVTPVQPPKEFICPISNFVMTDPVLAHDEGHLPAAERASFERIALIEAGRVVAGSNEALKGRIAIWLQGGLAFHKVEEPATNDQAAMDEHGTNAITLKLSWKHGEVAVDYMTSLGQLTDVFVLRNRRVPPEDLSTVQRIL